MMTHNFIRCSNYNGQCTFGKCCRGPGSGRHLQLHSITLNCSGWPENPFSLCSGRIGLMYELNLGFPTTRSSLTVRANKVYADSHVSGSKFYFSSRFSPLMYRCGTLDVKGSCFILSLWLTPAYVSHFSRAATVSASIRFSSNSRSLSACIFGSLSKALKLCGFSIMSGFASKFQSFYPKASVS